MGHGCCQSTHAQGLCRITVAPHNISISLTQTLSTPLCSRYQSELQRKFDKYSIAVRPYVFAELFAASIANTYAACWIAGLTALP